VDTYLARFTPEQFDEEVAFDRIEPDPLERMRIILKYGLPAIANGLAVKPNDLDPLPLETPAATNFVSPQQAIGLLRMAYGK